MRTPVAVGAATPRRWLVAIGRTSMILLVVASCERAGPDVPAAAPAVDTSALDTVPGRSPADAAAETDGPTAASSPEAELRAALERLLRGSATQPTAPDSQSWFSAATADALRSVSVDSAGNAIVDFHDLRTTVPNASSSAGSAMLLSELNAAVFSVPGIRSVEYRMDASCDLFWEWLQYGCNTVMRDGTQRFR